VTRFYFVRHGETIWNREGNRYCGRTDLPLTPDGLQQAHQIAKNLGQLSFDHAIVSPRLRARQTAQPLLTRLGLSMQIDERLREIEFGDWEGLTPQEIQHAFVDLWRAWVEDPTAVHAGGWGESAQEVLTRMLAVIQDWTARRARRVLVVSHNTAIRILIAGALGMPLSQYRAIEIDNGGVLVVDVDENGSWTWKLGMCLAAG